MNDPLAFFITIVTYGTWLPGDERGWVECQRGWQLPCRPLELEARARMNEDACVLSLAQRKLVEFQIAETCEHRKWILHAQNCRSTHLHTVVGAFETAPTKVRQDLKAWCTRRLKRDADSGRENWWAERGSVHWVFTEEELERVIEYVDEAQDRKHLEIKPDR